MSGVWSWFGGAGAAQKRKDAPKKAILDLRQQLDMLQKREKHLENQMAEQEKIAKANVSTNKTGMVGLLLVSGVGYVLCRICGARIS
jgi:charged multivesicular body protein 4